jgi:hypothetical protein
MVVGGGASLLFADRNDRFSQPVASLKLSVCESNSFGHCIGRIQDASNLLWELSFKRVSVNNLLLNDAVSQEQASYQVECSANQLNLVGFIDSQGKWRFDQNTTLTGLPQSIQSQIADRFCKTPIDTK